MSESKRCARCQQTLPLDDFYRNRARRDGRIEICKVCWRAREEEKRGAPIPRIGPKAFVDEHGKTCKMCNTHKPFGDFYRTTTGVNAGTYASQCKECVKARLRATNAPHLTHTPPQHRDENGRVCSRCKAYKPWSSFGVHKTGASGHGSQCFPCAQATSRESKARHAEVVKERRRAAWAQPADLTKVRRCARCTAEKPQAEFPANGKAGYCKPCRASYARENNRRHADRRREAKYGLSVEAYNALLKRQGNACAICRIPAGEGRDMLHVDHDHACCPGIGRSCGNCVRGLLCKRCNVALGALDDDPTRMRRAIEYVKPRLVYV